MKDYTYLFSSDYGIVKFVRIGDEYRFCSTYTDHDALVQPNETAKSAGFVSYDTGVNGQKTFKLLDRSSMTLKLGPSEEDGPGIREALGFEFFGWDTL